jgi:hypothetical protein
MIWVMPEISEAIAAPQQNNTGFRYKLAQNQLYVKFKN